MTRNIFSDIKVYYSTSFRRTCLFAREVSILYRCGIAYAGNALRDRKISGADTGILVCLSRQDNVSQEYLSAHFRVDKATITKSMKRLEKEGYIRRQADPSDRRIKLIRLTEKGVNVTDIVRGVFLRWSGCVLENLSLDEKNEFERLLQKAADNAWEKIHSV